MGDFSHAAHSKNREEGDMEELDKKTKSKGGRPVKVVKKNRVLTLKCSNYERMIILAKAKKVNLTMSEYLREMAISGKVNLREKALPREVLEFTGTLNHMAANLNQVAKKSNSVTDVLTKTDFLVLRWLSNELKEIAVKLKMSLS